jgi:hypothetical protein
VNKSELIEIIQEVVREEWDKEVDVDSTGEHADKTITQIKKEMESLKGKKPFNRGQFSELMFALRAKQGWKRGEGATGTSESKNPAEAFPTPINEYPYTRWKIHVKVKTNSNKTLDYKPVMLSKDSPNKTKALQFAKKQWKQDYEQEHGKVKNAKLVVIFNAS